MKAFRKMQTLRCEWPRATAPCRGFRDDRRRMMDLLSAQEIVLLISQDRGWYLPVGSEYRSARMAEAWRLLKHSRRSEQLAGDLKLERRRPAGAAA